jgi:snoRNA binding domain, fibrillarin
VPAAVLRAGRWLRWVDLTGRVVDERLIDADPERAAKLLAEGPNEIPLAFVEWIRQRSEMPPILVADRPLRDWLVTRGLEVRVVDPLQLHSIRSTGFRPDPEERSMLLALARYRLQRAMQNPQAALTALAREEERLQRVLRRETNAADSWVSEGSAALAEYARISSLTRERLSRHLAELTTTLEAHAREVAPNLSAVVGPVVAAHLISAAGGLEPLARMNASRIQLLGAKRRFGPGRSPRFGLLYHADGMTQVPEGRAGALARSVAALAAIAARADATTGRPISAELVRRRERRISQLRKRGA